LITSLTVTIAVGCRLHAMISFKSNFVPIASAAGHQFNRWRPRRSASAVASSTARPDARRQSLWPPSRLNKRFANVAYRLNHDWFLPSCFEQIRVAGQEHLPPSGPVIFAPTHRSRWDGLLLPYAVGPQVTGRYPRYMVTVDEMQGLQGYLIRRLGGFAIDTRAPGVSSLRFGIDLLHQGESLVVFPEGGNLAENRRRCLNRLHPGLARIAVKASLSAAPHTMAQDVRIVPIAINYRPRLRGRCAVDLQIGRPIAVTDYLTHNPKDSARQITADLRAALVQLSHCR
jgi:1-acyl-sn-glycerol-3-phosphate acyltransferase